MKPWWKSKKVWGTIAACGILLVGAREGWDPALARDVAWCLMSGVTIEGVIDAFATYRREK